MHDRVSLCKCSYWQVHETTRHWGDPAPGSSKISPHSPASPVGMHGGSLSESSAPGRCAASPGSVAGESGARAVTLAGRRVHLAGGRDSGPGLVRCRQARSSSPARPWTSLGIRCRAGSHWGTRQTRRRSPPLVSGRARSTGSAPDLPDVSVLDHTTLGRSAAPSHLAGTSAVPRIAQLARPRWPYIFS